MSDPASELTIDERIELIQRDTEEVLGGDRLRKYLEQGVPLKHYIGLEISGEIHLGTGLMCMGKVADLQRAGVEVTVFLADWHSWINEKLGGDREAIRRIALRYFKHGLEASLRCCGGDPDNVSWVLGSDLYDNNNAYWETLVDVAKGTNLARMQRSITITGRAEGDNVDFAKLLYPAMQVADIFALGVHIAHAGMDQRKAHVMALDVASKLTLHPLRHGGETLKPIAIHHPLILGLGQPPEPKEGQTVKDALSEAKMSKSDPKTAVFVHDEPKAIQKKIKKAYCPPKEVEGNPILDWAKKLLFRSDNDFTLVIQLPEKFGGGQKVYESYEALEAAYVSGDLHPGDLKSGVAAALIEKLAPAREAFAEGSEGAGYLAEIRELMPTKK